MAMDTVAETFIVLACLALATYGGHVTLHFFCHGHRVQPASSQQRRQGRAPLGKLTSLRAAVLSLMCAGCGTLTLHVVATLSGSDLSFFRLHFTRVMLLVCPLLLARHVCASGAPRGSGARAGYRRALRCLRSVLEGYLWTVLGATAIGTAFLRPENNFYPCWIPVSQSRQRGWSTPSSLAVVLDSGFMPAKTSNITSEGTNIELTESYFAASFWDIFLCSGTCIRHAWPEVLMYCAFFSPLLFYIILSYALSTSSAQASCLTGTFLLGNSQQLYDSDQKHTENLTTEFREEIPYVDSSNLITHPVIHDDYLLKLHESGANKCQSDVNKESISILSEVQLNSNDCVSKIVPATTKTHQKVQGTEGHRAGLPSLSVPAVLGAGTEAEPPEGEAACSVCRQLSPYLFLAACILFTQFFLLLPLWGAVVSVRCGQLQFPTPEFAFLPVFTAICFLYKNIS